VIGPAMPTAELLAVAARLTETEAKFKVWEAEVGDDDVLFIGPPPPAIVNDADCLPFMLKELHNAWPDIGTSNDTIQLNVVCDGVAAAVEYAVMHPEVTYTSSAKVGSAKNIAYNHWERLAGMGRKSSSDDYGDGIPPGKNNQVIECGSDLSFCKEEKCPLHENQENRSTALAASIMVYIIGSFESVRSASYILGSEGLKEYEKRNGQGLREIDLDYSQLDWIKVTGPGNEQCLK
ncbi:hypothetical protein Tco_1248296, partial [Tanacetum coccineum]